MLIEKIYIDRESEKDGMTLKVLAMLKDVPVEIVSDPEQFKIETGRLSLTEGKRRLWLTRFKGPLVKPCPATAESYLCCKYWVINTQTNCTLDCTYCILQNYLNQPLLIAYTNVHHVFREIDELIAGSPQRLFRIGTGELTDSFVLDRLTGWNRDLIEYASSRKFILEFKTKTAEIADLPVMSSKNIVISWSLNPSEIIAAEEFKTASLDERLRAALQAKAKGYRLGFHFDPILEVPDWQAQYTCLIEQLTETIDEGDVAWISLGTLRFPPNLRKMIRTRFPKSRITAGEFVRGVDGKMRYFRPVRVKIYQALYQELRKRWKKVFIYFCMENETVWKQVMGDAPENNEHLDFLFHDSLHRRFDDMHLIKPDRDFYLAKPIAAN
ncbi:MAG: hypothetical protein PHN49_10290 [Candidatus Omnitrophica bacterium]|nr:hypothetical protein [Candidatus Omnitrophota bacterium]MDD5672018.1 hypothetical protein [Candidatus Omnitrophota bacterium]